MLDSLDKLERGSDDPEIRERICELIAGIYVHGDPIAIRRRWIALVRRVATLEVIASLQGYFDQLLADESDPT